MARSRSKSRSGGMRYSNRSTRGGNNSRRSGGAVTHRLVIQVAQPAPTITGAELAAGRVKVTSAQPRQTKSIF